MKKFLSLAVISLLTYASLSAQENFYGTRNPLIGSSMYSDDKSANLNVEGSAYLAEEWRIGFVKCADKENYAKEKLKYSYLEDRLYVQGEVKEDANIKIKEFSIRGNDGNYHLFRSGFNAIEKFNQDTYFEVLTEGKFILLKKLNKRIEESRDYGSAVTNYSIVDRPKYYIYLDDKMLVFKTNDKDFKALLRDLKVNSFISKQGLDLAKETDMIELINHMNNQ